jgi:host factor-I protein
MSATKGLQGAFLEELKSTQVPVSVFLVNGVKLHGVIEEFDDEVIMLKGSLTQIIYKHAVSTVVPSKMVSSS